MRRATIFLFVFLLLVGFASAAMTKIEVKTVPHADVNLNIKDYKTNEIFEVLVNSANEYGDANFIYDASENAFTIGYFVRDQYGSKVKSGSLANQIAGTNIYIEAVPEGFKIIETPPEETEKNETVIEEPNSTNANSTKESNLIEETENSEVIENEEGLEKTEKVTAFSISKESVSISTQILYYAAGIIVLAILLFIFLRKRKKKIPSSKEIKVKKLSELKKDKEERIKEQEDVIKEAEKKLEDAKKELQSIKKEDKISDLKKKIIEEEKELMRLRKEDSEKDKDDDKED